jgi:membrane-associated phospholipid phosphatase
MNLKHTIFIVFVVISLLATTPIAAQVLPDERELKLPSIAENYSPLELTVFGIVSAGAMTLMLGGDEIVGAPSPSMGPPSRDSADWRFSEWANPNPDPTTQWLGGAPNIGGYGLPVITLAFYGAGALGSAFSSDFFIGDTSHELIAFGESLAWSMLIVNGIKFGVGRERPFVAKARTGTSAPRDQWDIPEKEDNISFPSAHAAAAAVTMTFLTLDLSDHLYHYTLRAQPNAVRWGVGRLLPALAGASVTWTVMYSRIKDQQHWLSDTVVGTLIGTTFATIFYTMHFDKNGDAKGLIKSCISCENKASPQNFAPIILSNGNIGFGWSTTF